MITSTSRHARRRAAATLCAGFLAVGSVAFGYPAAAGAEPPLPKCPNNTVVVQGEVVPAPGNQPCDDDQGDDGLLGNLPVVGNLPGVGGVL